MSISINTTNSASTALRILGSTPAVVPGPRTGTAARAGSPNDLVTLSVEAMRLARLGSSGAGSSEAAYGGQVQKRIRALLDARATSGAAGLPAGVEKNGKALTAYGIANGIAKIVAPPSVSKPGGPTGPISPLVSPLVSEPGGPTGPTSPLVSPLVS